MLPELAGEQTRQFHARVGSHGQQVRRGAQQIEAEGLPMNRKAAKQAEMAIDELRQALPPRRNIAADAVPTARAISSSEGPDDAAYGSISRSMDIDPVLGDHNGDEVARMGT